MVDPLGTAIGVVGLFSTCLDAWHLIEDGRSMSKEFVILRQRYLNLRLRFVLWGEACGLDICDHSDDGIIPQSIRSNVLATLGCIITLFEDGDKLKRRYGLDTNTKLQNHLETSNHVQALTNQYYHFEERRKRVKGHAGLLGSVRWAISDKLRFTTLIQHLGELLVDLEILTRDTGVPQKQRQLADREIQSISDLTELKLIEEAGLNADDPISDAASARISTLRSEPKEASNSSYYTARSNSPGHESSAEKHSSAPIVPGDSQWQRILASLREGKPSPHQNILVDESKGGDLLLWIKARHLLSDLPFNLTKQKHQKEVGRLASAIVPWIDGWPIAGDPRDIIAAIEGPLGTPYEGSVFYLRIKLSINHPFYPPDCRFLTKVYHPNINSFGQICFDLFDKEWSPVYTLSGILVSISGLLSAPNIEDPLVPEIATIFVQEPETYEQYARNYAVRYANARLFPVVNADGSITFQTCDTSLQEVLYCLANRATDDAIMLKVKYSGRISDSLKERKLVHIQNS
jgi:ubiquitin-conjugating enzyme E2 D/E